MTTTIDCAKGIVASVLEGVPFKWPKKQNQKNGVSIDFVTKSRLFLDVVGCALGSWAVYQGSRRGFCATGRQLTGEVIAAHAVFVGIVVLAERLKKEKSNFFGGLHPFTQGAVVTLSWVAFSRGVNQWPSGKRFLAIGLLGSWRELFVLAALSQRLPAGLFSTRKLRSVLCGF